MILDLWSLIPASGSKLSLADIEPGKYTIAIQPDIKPPSVIDLKDLFPEKEYMVEDVLIGKLDFSKFYTKKSNAVDLELIEPTRQERRYLQNIQMLGKVTYGDDVSWVEVLRKRIVIPQEGNSYLTQVSREQVSFHQLLSNVDVTDAQSKAMSIPDVNSASLPEYFEPERQLILFELRGKPDDERDWLLKNYPGYRWNIKNDRIVKELLRF